MTLEQKAWIDGASYAELLKRWRFAPSGDEMFQGDTGEYYKRVMFAKRDACDAVAVSKAVGWEAPKR